MNACSLCCSCWILLDSPDSLLSSSCCCCWWASRFLLELKNGFNDGLGVEPTLMVSTSGPESSPLRSSNWSNKSSISAGSTVPSEKDTHKWTRVAGSSSHHLTTPPFNYCARWDKRCLMTPFLPSPSCLSVFFGHFCNPFLVTSLFHITPIRSFFTSTPVLKQTCNNYGAARTCTAPYILGFSETQSDGTRTTFDVILTLTMSALFSRWRQAIHIRWALPSAFPLSRSAASRTVRTCTLCPRRRFHRSSCTFTYTH